MSTLPPSLDIRDLHSLDDCRGVVAVQEAVWGRDGETVPASVLLVSAKRGGILLGAFVDGAGAGSRAAVAGGLPPSRNASADHRSLGEGGQPGQLIGFVWSLAGVSDGAPSQWSHMLGVLPAFRRGRVAERLKLAQRDRALAAGVDLVEWTFDPLQAANAHFNLHVLGAVGASYGVDVYGALAGPLHRGTPTDRLIVAWHIREPHVQRRIEVIEARDVSGSASRLTARSAEVLDAPLALRVAIDGEWVRCAGVDAAFTYRRVLVPIPPRFSEMQQLETDLALDWRLKIRDVMTTAFERGYRAVDFYLDRDKGGGSYLLAKSE